MSSQDLLAWLVPALLSLIGYYMKRIAIKISELSHEIAEVGKSLAVTVAEQQDLRRRVDRVENEVFRPRQ